MLKNAILALAFAMASASVVNAAPRTESWTGPYVGLNAGGSFSNDGEAKTVGTPAFRTLIPTLAPAKLKTDSSGFIGGAQVGYNVRSGSIVYGVEAVINYLGSKKSDSFTSTATVLGTTLTTSAAQKIDYLGTLRLRAGVLATDRLLVYATGGLAFGGVKDSASVSANAAPSTLFWRGSSSSTRSGYALGGGVEYSLNERTSLKGEYLYYDLGSKSTAALGSPGVRGIAALNGIDYVQRNSADGSILRVGVNYRF